MAQVPADDKSTLVQVMGLVPSGNKPLPEPMLTKIHDVLWCRLATMNLINPLHISWDVHTEYTIAINISTHDSKHIMILFPFTKPLPALSYHNSPISQDFSPSGEQLEPAN